MLTPLPKDLPVPVPGCRSGSSTAARKSLRTKELVSLFAIWVASYMLNSLVAYADQIESKGKRISYPEAFAALPEEFNAQQLREALIAVGSTARPKDVTRAWLTRNHILERTSKFAYRKLNNNVQ